MKNTFSLLLLAGVSFHASVSAQEPLLILEGEARNNALGYRDFDFAGDVNGDGCDDIVTGAMDWTDFYKKFYQVHSGLDGSVLHSWRFGVDGDAAIAWSCGAGGDVDGDGLADVVLGGSTGIEGINGGETFVEVRSGGTGAIIHRWAKPSRTSALGTVVSGGGDVDGDGTPDILAREYDSSWNSWVRVYSGATGQLLYTVSRWVDPNARSWNFGGALDFCGDVNGDGCEDFLVGDLDSSAGGSRAGAAFVFSGKDGTELFQFAGTQGGSHFGRSVAGPGDVNDDGIPDFAVGIPRFEGSAEDTGRVMVYSGADGGVLHQWDGQRENDAFGIKIARIGDANQDGSDDLVVLGGVYDGLHRGIFCRVYSGHDGSEIARQRGGFWQDFGYAIAGGGDLNGDGIPDFAVSAPEYKVHTGRIYIYSGGPVLDVPALIAGLHTEIEARHFVKKLHTALAVSLAGPGITYVPRLEISLDLLNPAAVGRIIRADSQGQRRWQFNVPADAAGTAVWLQAVQYRHKSPVVHQVIQ